MKFCGSLPISSGVMQSPDLRHKMITGALVQMPRHNTMDVVLAMRHTVLGYEWQIIPIALSAKLTSRNTRYEHALLRRCAGYRFFVLSFKQDHLARGFIEPSMPYIRFLSTKMTVSVSTLRSAAAVLVK